MLGQTTRDGRGGASIEQPEIVPTAVGLEVSLAQRKDDPASIRRDLRFPDACELDEIGRGEGPLAARWRGDEGEGQCAKREADERGAVGKRAVTHGVVLHQ